jgi:hypothetical protein
MYLKIIKAIYDKHTGNIIHDGEKLNHIPNMKIRIKMPTLRICIQYKIRNLNQGPIRKEKSKSCLFADDTVFYTQSPKDSPPKTHL